MKLIKKLGTRAMKNGDGINSWGEFLCTFCFHLVERTLSSGKTAKSCGCVHNELISKSNKGRIPGMGSKKHTKEAKQKIREALLGENNPFYGKKHTEETKQLMKENHADFTMGNNPNWQKGISFEPYSPEFNKELKQLILERDNYQCQCPDCEHKSTKLDIHHIDFDKKNSSPENLITLCASCHTKTNGKNDRKFWINYYKTINGGLTNEEIFDNLNIINDY